MPALPAIEDQLLPLRILGHACHAHQRDLGVLGIARTLDHVRLQAPESAAVGYKVGLRQPLPVHDQAVPVEPRLIEGLPLALGHALDVEAGHKSAKVGNRILDFHALPPFIARCQAGKLEYITLSNKRTRAARYSQT